MASSKSNSSMPSNRSVRKSPQTNIRKSDSNRYSPQAKRVRKNSSMSGSNSPARSVAAQIKAQKTTGRKNSKNSSLASASNSPIHRPTQPKQSNLKRVHACNSSRSNSIQSKSRKQINKNNSSRSKSKSKSRSRSKSPPNNQFDRGNGQFRGRGRGRGDRGRGRGGFNGGFNQRNSNYTNNNNSNTNHNNNNNYSNNNNNYNNNNNHNNNNNNNNNNNFNRNNNNNNNRFGDNNDNNDMNNFNKSFQQRTNNFKRNNNDNWNNDKSGPTSQQKIVQELPKKPAKQIQIQEFIELHKQQGWFIQKYHPIYLLSQQTQRFNLCKKTQSQFLSHLNQGYYSQLNLTISQYKSLGVLQFEEKQIGQLQDQTFSNVVTLFLNDNVKVVGPPLFGEERDRATLFVPNLTKQLNKAQLQQQLTKIKGYCQINVSQPSRKEDFKRMAWIQFQSQQHVAQAIQVLKQIQFKGQKLQLYKACNRIRKAKIVTNYPSSRLDKDLQNVIGIAQKLDYEAKIYQSNSFYGYKFKSLRQKLQLFIVYLRKVHLFQYFQSKFYDSYRTLTIKSGMTLLLIEPKQNQIIQMDQLLKLDSKNQIIKEKGSQQYRKKDIQAIKIYMDAVKTKLFQIHGFNHTMQNPKYWKCTECRKKFFTIDHLIKHTTSRHQQTLTDIIQQTITKIYTKSEEEWQVTRASRPKQRARTPRRRMLKDFDDPQEEAQEIIKDRLKPGSRTARLINFLDI